MSKKERTQRANRIIAEADALNSFYAMNGHRHAIRLYAEDYDYLLGREEIVHRCDSALLDGRIEVVRGPSRRKNTDHASASVGPRLTESLGNPT